jgi:hypothetical protein
MAHFDVQAEKGGFFLAIHFYESIFLKSGLSYSQGFTVGSAYKAILH